MKYCSVNIYLFIIGYQSQDAYNKAPAKQVCETHYKTIYKLVFEDKVVKKCEDVPEKVCKYIKEKVKFNKRMNIIGQKKEKISMNFLRL